MVWIHKSLPLRNVMVVHHGAPSWLIHGGEEPINLQHKHTNHTPACTIVLTVLLIINILFQDWKSVFSTCYDQHSVNGTNNNTDENNNNNNNNNPKEKRFGIIQLRKGCEWAGSNRGNWWGRGSTCVGRWYFCVVSTYVLVIIAIIMTMGNWNRSCMLVHWIFSRIYRFLSWQ